MRIQSYLITACLAGNLLAHQASEQDTTVANKRPMNVLDDIIIEETYETLFEEEKPQISLELDFSDVVRFDDGMKWDSVDELLEANRRESGPRLEPNLSAPEMVKITPAPIKVFNAQFEKIRRWKLEITSVDGTIFRSMSGEGSPSKRIEWDGLSDTGEVLAAGQNYAYNFVAVDKAGNRRTFPGKTFTVGAFYMPRGDSLYIGLDPKLLVDETTLRATQEAKAYAREVASLIRYYSAAGKIAVQSSTNNIEEFLKLVSNDLIIDTQAIIQARSTQRSVVFIVE